MMIALHTIKRCLEIALQTKYGDKLPLHWLLGYLVACQVHLCDERPADRVMVADNDAGEDDVVDGVGDVTDRDHDVGVDEAGHGGGDKEDCQTKEQICNDVMIKLG